MGSESGISAPLYREVSFDPHLPLGLHRPSCLPIVRLSCIFRCHPIQRPSNAPLNSSVLTWKALSLVALTLEVVVPVMEMIVTNEQEAKAVTRTPTNLSGAQGPLRYPQARARRAFRETRRRVVAAVAADNRGFPPQGHLLPLLQHLCHYHSLVHHMNHQDYQRQKSRISRCLIILSATTAQVQAQLPNRTIFQQTILFSQRKKVMVCLSRGFTTLTHKFRPSAARDRHTCPVPPRHHQPCRHWHFPKTPCL